MKVLSVKIPALFMALYFCLPTSAQSHQDCVNNMQLRAPPEEIMASHPGGKLNRASHTITWNSPKAIASSVEYGKCNDEEVVLTKHVRSGQLSEEKILSTALAMGNTFLDDNIAQRLQQAVFKNRFEYHSDDGSDVYDLMDKGGYAVFNIEYNPARKFVRLSILE